MSQCSRGRLCPSREVDRCASEPIRRHRAAHAAMLAVLVIACAGRVPDRRARPRRGPSRRRTRPTGSISAAAQKAALANQVGPAQRARSPRSRPSSSRSRPRGAGRAEVRLRGAEAAAGEPGRRRRQGRAAAPQQTASNGAGPVALQFQATYMDGDIGGTTGSLLTAQDPNCCSSRAHCAQYLVEHQLDAIGQPAGAHRRQVERRRRRPRRGRSASSRPTDGRRGRQAAGRRRGRRRAGPGAALQSSLARHAGTAAGGAGAARDPQPPARAVPRLPGAPGLAAAPGLTAAPGRAEAGPRAGRAAAARAARCASAPPAAARRSSTSTSGGGGSRRRRAAVAERRRRPVAGRPRAAAAGPGKGADAVQPRARTTSAGCTPGPAATRTARPAASAPATARGTTATSTGFDCSGLTLYAWAPYKTLDHYAATQYYAGRLVPPEPGNLLPGDLVFWSSNGSVERHPPRRDLHRRRQDDPGAAERVGRPDRRRSVSVVRGVLRRDPAADLTLTA